MNKTVVGILGGGPAGMSCALWLKHLGLSPIIIERNAALGGQLPDIHRINRWVLGLPGRTGPELAQLYSNHVTEENIPVKYNTQLTAIEATAVGYRLILREADEAQTAIRVQALVIATGLQAQGIEVFSKTPELDSLYARGLIGCHPTDHLDKLECFRGKTVAVIGGGDNAYFTVKDVAAVAARTHLIIRSRPQAQNTIRHEVKALIDLGLVIEYRETAVETFRPSQDGIEICLNQLGSISVKIKVDKVFTRTGFTPNTKFLDTLGPLAKINKQASGYLLTDSQKRTSVDLVYAIGDVASPNVQSVVTAIAEGAIAARVIAEDTGTRE
ncbi:MAG: NAD(P)/FAD-dependent oxidoreductase [Candidatus Methylumidiphilus sp.]